MATTSTDKRKIVIVTVLFVIMLAGIAALAIFTQHKTAAKTSATAPSPSTSVDPNDHVDTASGEDVSNPSGLDSESDGQTTDQPLYLGTTSLLDYGVSTPQLNDLEYTIYQFIKSSKLGTKQVSLAIATIVSANHDPNSDTDTISFDLVFDQTTYKAKMDYSNTYTAHLYLTDPATGKLVYDSGDVTNQSL